MTCEKVTGAGNKVKKKVQTNQSQNRNKQTKTYKKTPKNKNYFKFKEPILQKPIKYF